MRIKNESKKYKVNLLEKIKKNPRTLICPYSGANLVVDGVYND